MPVDRELRVYLIPALIPSEALAGRVAVVIDILRATTTMIHALAAGAKAIHPCTEIDEARSLAAATPGKFLLTGERNGATIPGFDLGNSPRDFKAAAVRNSTIIMTTTNGTPALQAALPAERVLVGAFVNFSAVCEQLRADERPIALVCAGSDGSPSLEDTLFAGALVDHLCENGDMALNDAARLAWDSFENQGEILAGAFEVSLAGEKLLKIGLGADLKDAAEVDRFALAAEVRRDPVRVEVCAAGIKRCYWPHM